MDGFVPPHLPPVLLTDFTYNLPDEAIAKQPLTQRDASKLLIYKDKTIHDSGFKNLPEALDASDLLVFNQTKVIRARLLFQRETGARIEVFLLQPAQAGPITQMMESRSPMLWQCTIGNKKKWKVDEILSLATEHFKLTATQVDNDVVSLAWNADVPFSEVLEALGKIPIPPYLRREADEKDTFVYQTVYSSDEGSVAAPTAGLHFTPEVLNALTQKGISTSFLTLHVGAGTFKPVKSENVLEHAMHAEQIVVKQSFLIQLLAHTGRRIAVGTTSLRSLESLYWYGVKLMENPELPFEISQYDPYVRDTNLDFKQAIEQVLAYMQRNQLQELTGTSSVYVLPFYKPRSVAGIITNFHQPQSTLLLLISAFVGDAWRQIYEHALRNQYRFLSYGDSSLLWLNSSSV